jgi:predicted RNA-binding Zn ribbon-like protein
MKAKRAPEADELSIRFVNTVAWRLREPSEERLGSPELLLQWMQRNGLIAPEDARRVTRAWRAQPQRAVQIHRTAIELREAIYALLLCQLAGQRPPAAALHFLSDFLWRRPSGLGLDWKDGNLAWRSKTASDPTLDLLQPIALSAAELLMGNRAHRIRQCEDDRGCGWLFVDESRLQNRRWCSMGDCGNVAKIRRYRKRMGVSHGRNP